MTITLTAFASSPDRGRGLARDMRVRWALEEVGLPYEVRLLTFAEMKEPAHLARNPFGQIPTYEEGDLMLFESGGIIHHIAQTHAGLLPEVPEPRARAVTWMFAALNTVEPPILEFAAAFLTERDESWYDARLPRLQANIRKRLEVVSRHLEHRHWLDGAFSAADLLMASAVLRLQSSGLAADYPPLVAYLARAEARPAYQRAFAAQFAVFEAAEKTKGGA